MLSAHQTPTTSTPSNNETDQDQETEHVRDIHALTPPPAVPRGRWETGIHRSNSTSMSSEGGSSENFTSMSREFNALVLAGSAIGSTSMNNNPNSSENNDHDLNGTNNLLGRIGEDDDVPEDSNPLAIVPGDNLDPDPTSSSGLVESNHHHQVGGGELSVHIVKKEEVETKISAWQNAKIAKINNRFKREDAIINGWESEQVQKASSWMKKVERKLEEKRAKAIEKMQNDIAKAHRKAEERRASAEGKRGTKVAGVLEIANLMRAVGRPPAKRSFF